MNVYMYGVCVSLLKHAHTQRPNIHIYSSMSILLYNLQSQQL